MKTLMRAAALGAMLACTAMSAGAQTADPMFLATTLNLSAYGEVRATPDKATITMGVQTQAPTAAEAMAQNAARMTRVVEALRRAGVAEKDVQTTSIDLNAQYEYKENQPPRLTGYQAVNQVSVTINDLARLGPSIDAVVSAGANQINGIGFGIKDPHAAEDAARLAAVKALEAKAELYAGATGYHIARLVTLSEGGGYVPSPPRPMPMYAMAKADVASTPVAAGELSVRVDVTGLYELAK